MLSLLAGLTRFLRTAEQKVKVATHNAADKARMKANDVVTRMHDTADAMRQEATALEVRAKNNFKEEINRISSAVEGI